MNETLLYLIEVTVCLSAFTGLFLFFLKNEKNFLYNRIYLLFVPIVSLLIPSLHYEFSKPEAYSPLFYLPTQLQTQMEQTVLQETAQTSANYWMYVPATIYLIGALLVLLRFIIGVYAFYALRNKHQITKTKGIQVVCNAEIDNAFSFWNTMFIPDNSPNINLIIEHEQSHIRQGHSVDVIYYQLLTALLWFHPLIYILKNWLREQHEFAADSEVIQNNRSKYLYASALVHQSTIEPQTLIPFANHFYYSHSIKNRLKMISKTEKSIMGNVKMAFPLPLVLMLLFAFSFSVENFAQDTSEYNYEPGKMYAFIPAGEDFEEKKAAQIEYLLELHNDTISVEDIVFISSDQMDNLKMEIQGPDAVNEGSYTLKWEGVTISQNVLVDKNASNQPFTLYVNEQERQIVSNKIILIAPKTDDGTCSNDIIRRAITMKDGILPDEFYEFMGEHDVNLEIKVFDVVYVEDGEEEKLEGMTAFLVKN